MHDGDITKPQQGPGCHSVIFGRGCWCEGQVGELETSSRKHRSAAWLLPSNPSAVTAWSRGGYGHRPRPAAALLHYLPTACRRWSHSLTRSRRSPGLGQTVLHLEGEARVRGSGQQAGGPPLHPATQAAGRAITTGGSMPSWEWPYYEDQSSGLSTTPGGSQPSVTPNQHQEVHNRSPV